MHPLGIGTFRLDAGNPDGDFAALKHSFEMGQNFMTLNMVYYGGTMNDALARYMREIPREEMFYMFGVDAGMRDDEPPIDKHVRAQVDAYLQQTGLEILDGVQLHDYAHTSLAEVYRVLRDLRKEGKVGAFGASNVGVEQLREIEAVAKLDVYEGMYNFECRENERDGVFGYCQENDIVMTCYQPIRRGLTAKRNYPVVADIAAKYGATQNQVVLNWIACHRGINPLIKSTDCLHIAENHAALELVIDRADYTALDAFEAPELAGVRVDWDHTGEGTLINRVPYLLGDYLTPPRTIKL